MTNKIRVGILGYGNLGRGVLYALTQNPDMETVAVFTRRDPAGMTLPMGVPAVSAGELEAYAGKLDVLILCGGSAKDLPEQTPRYAQWFNVVDSFDTHARIPEHFDACHEAAKKGGHIALISTGWDPGLFSLQRLLGQCVLPEGESYTFWGRGVSQGHSDAVRRISGVLDARQYTVPVEAALNRVRSGETPTFTAREMHRRVCYVVAEAGADLERIRREIVTMPNYFEPYDTEVHFISAEEMERDHRGMPHGGRVLRSGHAGDGSRQGMEFSLELESNPAFTAGVLVACARAAVRLARDGQTGAKTLLDVPPAYLSPKSPAELRKELL